MDALRAAIALHLKLRPIAATPAVSVLEVVPAEGYARKLISYPSSSGDTIQAFLFSPDIHRSNAAILILHQHNSEWAIGKGEVAGIAGSSLQAFGPVLARAGITVLAPDAIGFESRTGPTEGKDALWLQYYNHMAYRLIRGELLMTDILADTASAVTVLQHLSGAQRIGLFGHSYGGNVALFAAALDTRIAFTCASGAACSYRYKLAHNTGLEMALIIPGFAARFDIDDLIRSIAPRKLFIVSSDHDPYSADATDLVARARPTFPSPEHLVHFRSPGKHALDEERFHAILHWLTAQAR